MGDDLLRVAVFVSGSGTNLQAVLDACMPPAPARVVLVLSNNAEAGGMARAAALVLVLSNNAEAGGMARAVAAGVETHVIADPADGEALNGVLRAAGINLVVLAGYLKLVPATVVAAFDGRMINIHPALLPAFGGAGMYGMRVHEAVLASGATVTGPTVHVVTAEYDRGPILAQWPVPVLADDTPASLRDRVLAVEHQILPAVVLAAARAGRPVRLPPRAGRFSNASLATSVEDELAAASPPDR